MILVWFDAEFDSLIIDIENTVEVSYENIAK